MEREKQGEGRRRVVYAILILFVVALGLASRKFGGVFPESIHAFPGDLLWATMVFFGWGFLFPRMALVRVAVLALVTSFAIECSQLYKADWIMEVRRYRLGHLVLGSSFYWPDFLAYSLGVGLGALVEKMGRLRRNP